MPSSDNTHPAMCLFEVGCVPVGGWGVVVCPLSRTFDVRSELQTSFPSACVFGAGLAALRPHLTNKEQHDWARPSLCCGRSGVHLSTFDVKQLSVSSSAHNLSWRLI